MRNKGFTLVELLAVIVILSIILVISVPKILEVIGESKTESIKSSVKLIADSGEKEYSRRILTESLDQETNPIECLDLNSTDYDTCSISFNNNGVASVAITGKGKFDGYTCRGTKESVRCAENGEVLTTEESCFAINQEVTYTIKNYDSCVNFITLTYPGAPTEDIQALCRGENISGMTTTEFFSNGIEYGNYTEQELLDSNVVEKGNGGVSITGYSDTCEKDVVIPSEINGGTVTAISELAFTDNGVPVSNLSSSNEIGNVTLLNNIYDEELNPTFIAQIIINGLGITSVVIPDTVTYIGESAFEKNNISNIVLPSSLTTIGYSAFANNNITSVVIPNTVTTIEDYAFYNNNTTSVTFPTTPLTVKCGVFNNEETPSNITYPGNVTVSCTVST